jgi:uncharacterized protein YndB with AHSA1/START domain
MAARISARTQVDVRRPPDEVFAYLADVRRHAEWSPKPYRVEGLDGPVALGTKFTSYGWVPRDPDHRNDVEVVEYDPPRALAFSSAEQDERFVNTFTLTPTKDGTRVERTIDMPRPHGFLGAVFPLVVSGFIRPAVAKGMRMLKQRLEDGA